MSRSLTLSILTLLGAAGVFVARSETRRADAAPLDVSHEAEPDPAADAKARDADIALFERRVGEDPASAADRARLAMLYLRRARETGSFTDVTRAEREAKRSLALREGHNEGSWSTLASARLAQHDFVGALDAARALRAAEPEVVAHAALEGEILLELGRYEEAAVCFVSVERETATLTTAPRLSRWYELTGHLDRAVLMARNAQRIARANDGLSAEQRAWFAMRTGDLEAKRGQAAAADSMYRSALAINPGDYRVLAAQARLAAQRGNWREAIAAGEASMSVQLEPGTLGVLRDAWLAVGDSAQGASYASAMMASALTQPGAIHRAWGLHLVEHGERLGEVLARVRRELQTRHDVYGYDLEAWTLHAMGRDAEAWRAMQSALRAGTEDAVLWYHAGMIAAANGNQTLARDYLTRALALNPAFGIGYVREAHAVLATLPNVADGVVSVPTHGVGR